MNNDNILMPGRIVIITDSYADSTMTYKVLKTIDLSLEQKEYDDRLLTGYANCPNLKCMTNYRIESSGPKFCPHCGRELVLEVSSFATVYKFGQYLISKGLIEAYNEIAYHNTGY